MQIRFNNNATFFEEHRADYERSVKAPLYALAEDLAFAVQAVDASLETRPSRVVSRIRRDTRFARDKSPYRDHMWISWRSVRGSEDERKPQIPELYFSVQAGKWDIGSGYYDATPATMKAFRAHLRVAPSAFLSVLAEPAFTEHFALHGDDYRRLPEGIDDVPPEVRPWYAKKSFYVNHGDSLDAIGRGPEFVRELARLMALLAPLHRYVSSIPPIE